MEYFRVQDNELVYQKVYQVNLEAGDLAGGVKKKP
jgi:hypothetical protein